jgi:Filamentous haemagglutinin family outer membrane protein
VNGNAAPRIPTGKLNIAASLLETQMGGDINIIGPGGGIAVGHTSLDTLQPNQEGIMTLGGGSVRAFTDDSILVNQSRIMTQQGGDIGLFVANADINAGSGPKTYASSPSVSEICTNFGYCYTNPQGLVTGAGIAALVTLPGQDPTRSNVTLIAPRGTIDLGSAGARGNDITLVAQIVLNSFNIQATGTVTGLAFTQPPNTALAVTASNTTAATQQSGQPGPAKPNDQPSIVIVEVLGYGGSGGGGGDATGSTGGGGGQAAPSASDNDDNKRRRSDDQQ